MSQVVLTYYTQRRNLLDAVRVADGKTVVLKYVPRSTPEIEIGKYLASEELKNDPHNHAVPLLDVLEDENDPENAILVFPLLRRLDSPPVRSVREALDFVQQSLEVSALKNAGIDTDLVHRVLSSFTNMRLLIGMESF